MAAVLGAAFGEYRTRGAVIRDFGLVEFSWERRPADRTWRGAGFAVQVHRLERERAGTGVVNRPGSSRCSRAELLRSRQAV